MDYPYARHIQRYEYIMEKGWVTDRVVYDIGCGFGEGSRLMSMQAKCVIGIDPTLDYKGDETFVGWAPVKFNREKFTYIPQDVFSMFPQKGVPTDNCIVVAVEVFEHMPDAKKFISHLAPFARYAVFTTPLAKTTGPTRNREHVAEYSHTDFINTLSSEYNILEEAYQLSNLEIVPTATPNGDSINPGHVVQMAYCERKSK